MMKIYLDLGAMDPMNIGFIVDHWKKLGFHTHIGIKNPRKWVDVCVVSTAAGCPTLPCDWIEINNGTASLKKKGTKRTSHYRKTRYS